MAAVMPTNGNDLTNDVTLPEQLLPFVTGLQSFAEKPSGEVGNAAHFIKNFFPGTVFAHIVAKCKTMDIQNTCFWS